MQIEVVLSTAPDAFGPEATPEDVSLILDAMLSDMPDLLEERFPTAGVAVRAARWGELEAVRVLGVSDDEAEETEREVSDLIAATFEQVCRRLYPPAASQ